MNLHVTANPSISTKLLIPQSNQGVIERVIGHRGMRFVADCERDWVNMSDMTGTGAGPCPFPPFRHSLHYHGLDGLAGAVHQNNIRTTYQSGRSPACALSRRSADDFRMPHFSSSHSYLPTSSQP